MMGRPEGLFDWRTVNARAIFPPEQPGDSQPDDGAYRLCNLCDRPGENLLGCMYCHAQYCSATCRNKDGMLHDRICPRFGPAPNRWIGDGKDRNDDDSDNSGSGVDEDDKLEEKNGPCRVLFWPQRESAPKFVWLEKRYIFGRIYEYLLEHVEVPSGDWIHWAQAHLRPELGKSYYHCDPCFIVAR